MRHHFRQSGNSKYGIITRLCSSIPDFFAILLEYHYRSPKPLSSNAKKYTSANPFVRLAVRNFLRTICHLVGSLPGRNLLDAGCGEGYVMHILSQKQPRISFVGIDNRMEALETARLWSPAAAYICADIIKLPFREKTFDITVCTEVIEHVVEYDETLRELRRVTSGYCILSAPWEPFFSIVRFLGGKDSLCGGKHPDHIHRFTRREITEKMAGHFRIEKITLSFPWLVIVGKVG